MLCQQAPSLTPALKSAEVGEKNIDFPYVTAQICRRRFVPVSGFHGPQPVQEPGGQLCSKLLLREGHSAYTNGADLFALGKAEERLELHRAKRTCQQMDVVEPNQMVAVVMVGHSVNTRDRQRVHRADGSSRLTERRYGDTVRGKFLDRQEVREYLRIAEFPMQVDGVLHAVAIDFVVWELEGDEFPADAQ